MIDDFKRYIAINNLCIKDDKLLLGVSGGIDSIVMMHLFRMSGYNIALAHCNFQLRDEESDKDEAFVTHLAENYQLPIHTIRFNTPEIAEKEGISIQMAARDLRYEWFEELRQQHHYDYIAIAHNNNDLVETFLINLVRGTGIKGLTGIKEKSGAIIRPLLFASRKMIDDYCRTNNFEYREDSSNKTTKYSRNLIRHEIIPAFESINPSFIDTMTQNINTLKNTEKIYYHTLQKTLTEIADEQDKKTYFAIDKIEKLEPVETYMFEFLNPYGFSISQINDIIASLDGISGKQFFSPTHRLIKDRDNLILEEISLVQSKPFFIEETTGQIEYPIPLILDKSDKTEEFQINTQKNIAQLDYDKLEFPLTLRKWNKGDYFMPLGMQNLKKVSDFFIDQKVPIPEKEKVWIIESGNKIAWIAGMRIDERFKITENTTHIFQLELPEA
ncbi:MAG TPA: tRNA lysidine(34) synthetase TilS [Bacteroidales bacterium]|nr:tRNA lysidine(34) synthetase TilS [Bacteroidales bacterium]